MERLQIRVDGSLIKRFWEKVDKADSSKCWNWIASTNGGYHGEIKLTHTRIEVRANRVSWVIHNGQIPNNLDVLHKCTNKLCVNPEHLYLGTATDNALDRERDTPHRTGRRSKFSREDIDKILELRSKGVSQTEIGRIFSRTQQTIFSILSKGGKVRTF